DRRLRVSERSFEQPTTLDLRRITQVTPIRRDHVECDERRWSLLRQLGDAGGSRMQAKLERVEIEPVRCRDHDLAVHHAPGRQPRKKSVVQLREVAIERSKVATLDEYIGLAAKHQRAKSIPLGLVQKASAGGKRVRELREHRLDWRRYREGHAPRPAGSV